MAEIKPLYLVNGMRQQMQTGDLYAFLQWKAPVRLATTGPGTLASSFENGDTLDALTLVTGDRILIKDQTDPKENGIYVVNASGAPTRAPDADTGAKIFGSAVVVLQGATNPVTVWAQGGTEPVLGVTGITYQKVGGAGIGYTFQSNTWDFTQTVNDLRIADTLTHVMRVKPNESYTADRVLNIILGDADRTLTLGGNTTLNGGTHSGTNTGDIQPVIGCSLTNSGNLTINNTTFTVLTFDTENYDAGGFHSTSSNTGRITIPTGKGGKYLFTCSINWAPNATGVREAFFRVNGGAINPADGALVVQQASAGGNVTAMAFSAPISVAAGDYVEVLAYQDSGGSLDIGGGVGYSPVFTATFLGT